MMGNNGETGPDDGAMIGRGALTADAVIVRKLNHLFYDVEAERYDERHPEVIEGDAGWWSACGQRLVGDLRSARQTAIKILDVGCGTGFVSSLLSEHLDAGDLIIGIDQSAGMLRRARSKVAGKKAERCRFFRGDAASLPFADHSFDMLTLNSLLHHVYDYRAVLSEVDRLLVPGGYLVLAHEPNKEFFQSRFIRLAASAWKLAGFGMKVPQDICDEINARLKHAYPSARRLRAEELLRLVEYHSPVEQGTYTIDRSRGFSPRDLLAHELAGYELLELNQYSTFYHRPVLERRPRLLRAAKRAAGFLNGNGNLFSAVLRKDASRQFLRGSPTARR
jgi:ubiquinone/menaquinone biosynthesis C-methylase UbiE